jgi:hypothetical protein
LSAEAALEGLREHNVGMIVFAYQEQESHDVEVDASFWRAHGKFQDYVVRLSEKLVIFCFFVWCRT